MSTPLDLSALARPFQQHRDLEAIVRSIALGGLSLAGWGTLMEQIDAALLAERSLSHAAGRAEAEEVTDALMWVLPMAKGYAHEHPVGDNIGKVQHAESILARFRRDMSD